jgi:predicted ATPase
MFKSMRLKNFKAYKDSGEVPLAPLTIIVGANNSGKSTLFHGLLALAQTVRGGDHGWGPRLVTRGLVDLNGFNDIVHGGVQKKQLPIQISINLDAKSAIPRTVTDNGRRQLVKFTPPDTADISFGLDERLNAILVTSSTLRTGDKTMISVERKHDRWSLATSLPGAHTDQGVDFSTIFPCLTLPRSEPLLEEAMKAFHVAHYCAGIWTDIFARLVSHVGPLRVRVPWHTSIGARTSSEFGLGGENLLAALGSEEKDRSTGRTLLELVNDSLAKYESLKSVHLDVVKTSTGQMLVSDEGTNAKGVNVAAMGEGVSQILPIIARCIWGEEDECLLVEQPELHLHPALQAELGDLFIDVAKAGHRQILVETHSEHLLLRVRRRIAEGSLKPNQVSILFVEKHGGESEVLPLDLNIRGHFSNWPKGFFDEAYQEAMALAEAASKKG